MYYTIQSFRSFRKYKANTFTVAPALMFKNNIFEFPMSHFAHFFDSTI